MEVADDAGLVEHLRANDAPCPGCRYSMLGSVNLVCPECGRRFRASDLGRMPRAAWQVAMLSWRGWVLGVMVWVGLDAWNQRLTHDEGLLSAMLASRHGVGLLPGLASACFMAWLIARTIRKNRSQAEVFLKLGWGTLGAFGVGLALASA